MNIIQLENLLFHRQENNQFKPRQYGPDEIVINWNDPQTVFQAFESDYFDIILQGLFDFSNDINNLDVFINYIPQLIDYLLIFSENQQHYVQDYAKHILVKLFYAHDDSDMTDFRKAAYDYLFSLSQNLNTDIKFYMLLSKLFEQSLAIKQYISLNPLLETIIDTNPQILSLENLKYYASTLKYLLSDSQVMPGDKLSRIVKKIFEILDFCSDENVQNDCTQSLNYFTSDINRTSSFITSKYVQKLLNLFPNTNPISKGHILVIFSNCYGCPISSLQHSIKELIPLSSFSSFLEDESDIVRLNTIIALFNCFQNDEMTISEAYESGILEKLFSLIQIENFSTTKQIVRCLLIAAQSATSEIFKMFENQNFIEYLGELLTNGDDYLVDIVKSFAILYKERKESGYQFDENLIDYLELFIDSCDLE